ncbi:MAG: fused response regulator/phosphatase [Burkholderiales bacterium]|nr:fused response regulator/phosphatase [Burkholderiales bacterium]
MSLQCAPEMMSSSHLAGSLDILLVDDSPAERTQLEAFLLAKGHRVRSAGQGEEALALFDEERTDIVLMDVMMPVMDGIEATRRIKARCKRWVPVILLSGLTADTDTVRGLEAGADDYLSKPLHLPLLNVKLQAFQRIAQTAHMLAQRREEAEAETAMAIALMEGMVKRQQGLQDPALSWAVHPSSRFSGDLVAAARTPSGRLVAMLADATGHGLPAAISLLPMVQVFYGMLRKDLGVGDVAGEMNRRLREYAPPGVYMAAALIAFDPARKQIEVWNGGIPPGVWVCEGKELSTDALGSRHLPLGILPDAQFDSTCIVVDVTSGGHVVFFSDGLIEATDAVGTAFGVERVRTQILAQPAAEALPRILQAAHAHMNNSHAHDDISIMMIELA